MTSSAYLLDWGCHRRRLIHFLNRPTVRPLRDQNIFLFRETKTFSIKHLKLILPSKHSRYGKAATSNRLKSWLWYIKEWNVLIKAGRDTETVACTVTMSTVHSPYRPCPYPHRQILVPPSKRIRTSFSQAGGLGGGQCKELRVSTV